MSTQRLRLIDVEPPRPGLMQRVRAAIRSFTIGPMSLKDPALAKLFGNGYRTTAGVPVTEESAFGFSAVFNAVLQISNDIAKLPLNIKRRKQGGGSEDYIDSPLYNLLKLEPNPEMGSMELRRTMTAHALTCHGGYAEIERDGNGRAVNLWVLSPDRVKPFRERVRGDLGQSELGPLQYEIDGGRTKLKASDILHIHGLGYDGYVGYSVIQKARQAIGLALAAEQFGSAFFGNGSTFGGILTTTQDFDEEQSKDHRALIESYHQSAERAHRLLVIGGGWTYTPTGVDPQKGQMNELREKQIEEVARFFRIPPYRLGVNTPGTVSYSSVEMANLDYYTGALLDWITTWEQELNRKLIPRLERRQQFIKHNANAFLRADIKTRYDSYGVMLDRGVFCADDVLELEDMNPQPDGQGKLYLVQGAQVPKNKVVALADALIVKNTTPPPSPPPPPPPGEKPTVDEGQAKVDEANARARAAETVAAEARVQAEVDRGARMTAEASGVASREEIERLSASERQAANLAVQLTALSETLRADVSHRQEALDAANAALAASNTERGEAAARATFFENERAAALVAAESARALVSESASAAEKARAEAAAAAVARDDAARQAQEADARAVAETERAALVAANAAQVREEAASRILVAEQERDSLSRIATDAAQREAAAVAAKEAAEAEVARATAARLASAEASAVSAADAAAILVAAEEARDLARQEARDAAAQAIEAVTARQVTEVAMERANAEALEATKAAAGAAADALVAQTNSTASGAEVHAMQIASAVAESLRLQAVSDAAEQRVLATEAIAREFETATSLALVRQALAAAEAREAEARAAAVTAVERAAAEEQLRATAESVSEAAVTAGIDRAAAVLAAHRDLFVDVMRRMIDRECERVRRAQQSPAKLRHLIDTFYDGHEELCNVALAPAMRVHLAWTRSTEDPLVATRRFVAQHIEQSIRQLRTVLDGDAEELAVSVTALLRQWETDRVHQIADIVLQRGIDHARGSGSHHG